MQVSIYRYNPDVDADPYMQDFDLEIPGGRDLMVLDVLEMLKEQDPSVTYRRSCREGVCGSDGLNMNGRNGDRGPESSSAAVSDDAEKAKEEERNRAGELEEDSSVRAEETESSLSDTYEIALARAGNVCGAVSSAFAATEARLLFLRLPPRRVRLGSLCIVAESIRAMII